MNKKVSESKKNLEHYLVNQQVPPGYPLLLKDTAQVESLIQKEREYLNSLNFGYSISVPNSLAQHFSEIDEVFNRIQANINQLKQIEKTPEFGDWTIAAQTNQNCANLRNAVNKDLLLLYDVATQSGIGLPHEKSPERITLEKAVKSAEYQDTKKGIVEGYLFPHSNNYPVVSPSGKKNRDAGRIHGRILRLKLSSTTDSELESITDYQQRRAELAQTIEEANAKIHERISFLQDLENQSQDFLGEADKTFTELMRANSADLAKKLEDVQAELEGFKDQVKKAISLKGPISYWEEKATTHKDRAANALWGLLAVGIISGIGIYVSVTTLSEKFAKISEINVLHSALLVVAITAWLWTVKTILRSYLSNTHLMNDAEERLAMTKSYLALQESDKPLNDSTIAPVLAALFRPAGDGIVKDEAPPLAILEFLNRGSKA